MQATGGVFVLLAGGGSCGEGVGVVVDGAVVAAEVGAVVAGSGNFWPWGPMKGCAYEASATTVRAGANGEIDILWN